MRHTLLVLAHPRPDSLTARTAAQMQLRIKEAGGTVDLLDLYAEDFDPRLTPADEPDWEDREKRYSPEAHAHMDRITAADDILVVFPVWWFAPPAVVKGWIDRVWNYGFAYGRSRPRLAGKRMLWLGLAGGTYEDYAKTGLATALDLQLRVGVSEFCGIAESSVTLLHGTELSGVPQALRPARVAEVLEAAGAALDDHLPR
ncbi:MULTISPECIES: NAD(P)H oxidoreductase [unclassified Streptomyces]|uniref:NAD(P)H oxidoreductase n=1 Tax=unclassified Streptomyces TaxID=2593676 RepID=UPI00093ECE96|nr:NAD(P)H oxidoreductase [Streptomyces sp. CB02414]OKI84500.1 NADPH oxidoreductase [Streptomyces sp. CB02414]